MKRIFGKEKNITINDLQNNLLGKRENESLEAKKIDNSKNLADLVFKPLVGFLNKLDREGGLLILGVEANHNKIDSIIGVNEDLIKNLEDRIIDDILAYPNLKSKYNLEIEPIQLKDNKFVCIIEIHNDESSLYTYYSNHKNEGYIRNGYSTNTISLVDFINLVKKRSSPRVKIKIDCGLAMKISNPPAKVIAYLSYINEGNTIGKNIVSIIEIYVEFREGMNIPEIPVKGLFRDIYESLLPKSDNPKYIMVKKLQVSLDQFKTVSVSYPTLQIQIGQIDFNQSLFGDEKKVIIKAITFEETSKIEQEFALTLPSKDSRNESLRLNMPSCIPVTEIFTFY